MVHLEVLPTQNGRQNGQSFSPYIIVVLKTPHFWGFHLEVPKANFIWGTGIQKSNTPGLQPAALYFCELLSLESSI